MSRYQEALQWLYSVESRGINFDVERIVEASRVRCHPERGLVYVHVAGSNGKGSVVSMLESVLRLAGYRTGQFSSPHLHHYVERVRIEGRPIRRSETAQRLFSLRDDPALPPLTFFEYTTLLAFEAFADAQCDVVLLEVGLGGKLDATNIIVPRVSVITNISLDHQDILGATRTQIAREKAGIMKHGVPCIVGARDLDVRQTLADCARRVQSPVKWIGQDFDVQWEGMQLTIRVGGKTWDDVQLGLRGRHQADNAACVVATLDEIHDDFPVSDEVVRMGLREVKWPGRLEFHQSHPSFLFDAAHNHAGCQSLAEYLVQLAWLGKMVLLFGAMKGKKHQDMLASFDSIVDSKVYTSPNISRAQDASQLAKVRSGIVTHSVGDGLDEARRIAGQDGLVVVAGSIFLVSEARALVKGIFIDPPIKM